MYKINELKNVLNKVETMLKDKDISEEVYAQLLDTKARILIALIELD